MKPPRFTTRDYVFAALVALGQFIASAITIPLTFPLTIFGANVIVYAPFAAFFLVIGLLRLRKPGSVLLISTIYALIGLFISPVIFFFVFSSALLTEGACSLIFRGYDSTTSRVTAALLHYSLMLPASMIFSLWLMPADYVREHFGAGIAAWAIAELLVVAGVLAGALAGTAVGRELVKAGRLRVEECS